MERLSAIVWAKNIIPNQRNRFSDLSDLIRQQASEHE
jgi:hypothetical protein